MTDLDEADFIYQFSVTLMMLDLADIEDVQYFDMHVMMSLQGFGVP